MNDFSTDVHILMQDLAKALKTKEAVAKALSVSKQAFNYWFNHAEKVPYVMTPMSRPAIQ